MTTCGRCGQFPVVKTSWLETVIQTGCLTVTFTPRKSLLLSCSRMCPIGSGGWCVLLWLSSLISIVSIIPVYVPQGVENGGVCLWLPPLVSLYLHQFQNKSYRGCRMGVSDYDFHAVLTSCSKICPIVGGRWVCLTMTSTHCKSLISQLPEYVPHYVGDVSLYFLQFQNNVPLQVKDGILC